MPQSPEQLPVDSEINSQKMASYLRVIEEAYRCAFWASDAGLYVQEFTVNLALAVLDAHLAGLTREEIKTAVQVGETYGMN